MATSKKTSPTTNPNATTTVVVVEPLRCDGVDYAPGDVVDLDVFMAQQLLDEACVRMPDPAPAAP